MGGGIQTLTTLIYPVSDLDKTKELLRTALGAVDPSG